MDELHHERRARSHSPTPALPRKRERVKETRRTPSPACGGGLGWGLFGTVIVSSSSLHPPCRGVMISISSPFLSGVCAHLARGSTSKFSAIAKCVPSYSSSLSSASTLPAEI